jgi:hypothetical protein
VSLDESLAKEVRRCVELLNIALTKATQADIGCHLSLSLRGSIGGASALVVRSGEQHIHIAMTKSL